MIKIKRAYEPVGKSDGVRYLVDRLWPRGLKKEELQLEGWNKEVAPSNALREWFKHDPKKWPEFQLRYKAELEEKPKAWEELLKAARDGDITLVYSAKDIEHNNAMVLGEFLSRHLASKSHRKRRGEKPSPVPA